MKGKSRNQNLTVPGFLLYSVFRIPYSVFRIPYSVFRISHSAFRISQGPAKR